MARMGKLGIMQAVTEYNREQEKVENMIDNSSTELFSHISMKNPSKFAHLCFNNKIMPIDYDETPMSTPRLLNAGNITGGTARTMSQFLNTKRETIIPDARIPRGKKVDELSSEEENSNEKEEEEEEEEGDGKPSNTFFNTVEQPALIKMSTSLAESHDIRNQILKGRKYMMRINDRMRINWDLFVMACATWNCFSVPLAISLIPNAFDITGLVVMDFIIDFFFLIDIILNFRTTYINTKGEEISDPKLIAKHYLKLKFWIDFLSCFPFDYFAKLFTSTSDTKMFDLLGLLKLTRIARLTKIINFLNVTEQVKMTLKLLKLIFFLLLYLHSLACGWYFIIARAEDEYIPPQDYMYVETDLFSQSISYKYFMSLYMALAMLNGGECGPATTEQLMFACGFILIGAIITANMFGTMAVIVSLLNRKQAKFQQKLDLANTCMKNMCLGSATQTKVINYIFYTQSSQEQHTELKSFLRLISPSLRMEIIRHMLAGVLKRNSVFKEQTQGVINFIIDHLETLTYYPEDTIILQGDSPDHLFFIKTGDCHVGMIDQTQRRRYIKVLRKGSMFGELALLNGGKRSATVTALNYCILASLTSHSFKQLLTLYPGIQQLLYDHAKLYDDPIRIYVKESINYLELFAGCDNKLLNDIINLMKVEEYNHGTFIQHRNQIPTHIIFIVNGNLELKIEMEEKKETSLDILGPGSILNVHCALEKKPSKFSIYCIQNASVMLLSSNALINIIKNNKKLKDGQDYLRKKWRIQSPICDYTNNITRKRDLRQRMKDCLRRNSVFKQKQSQIDNKFVNLLENVKKQCLMEKRKEILTLLELPEEQNEKLQESSWDAENKDSTDMANIEYLGNLQNYFEGRLDFIDQDLVSVKNDLRRLIKDTKI